MIQRVFFPRPVELEKIRRKDYLKGMAYGRSTSKAVEDHQQYIKNAIKSKSRVSYWKPRNKELEDALSAWLRAHDLPSAPYAQLMASHWTDFSRYCNGILKKCGIEPMDIDSICIYADSFTDLYSFPKNEETAYATAMIAQYYFL